MHAQSAPATIETLRQATEGRDADTLISLYADNAEMQVVDRLHPPSKPLELRGKEAIRAYLADICGRAMTHQIRGAVTNGDVWAYTQFCTYPDATHVLCMASVTVADGKIARQTNVQVWDE
ncbi:MAG: nuclear transport factor 2 family protein [Ktedonobacterales bacterium]|nr:nuclear transport factor 2 family protein [Ktedonobacterales bacterium]